MKTADLARSLDMIEEALLWAVQVSEKESERNAALHMQAKVMYSPLVVALNEAITKIKAIRLNLIDDGQGVEP